MTTQTRAQELGISIGQTIATRPVGTDEGPLVPPMSIHALQSAGWCILYDTETGEPSTCNNNMKATQLLQKRDNGTLVFTETQPTKPPWRGSVKCFLHPSQPNHQELLQMGFKPCRKATMPNQYQADNHGRNKHATEWKALDDRRQREERTMAQATQNMMAEALAKALKPENTRTPEQIEQANKRMAHARAGRGKGK